MSEYEPVNDKRCRVGCALTETEYEFIKKYCKRNGLRITDCVLSALHLLLSTEDDFVQFRPRRLTSFGTIPRTDMQGYRYKGEPYDTIRAWAKERKFSYECTLRIQNIAYRLDKLGITPDTARTMDPYDMVNTLSGGMIKPSKHFTRVYLQFCKKYVEFLQEYHPAEPDAHQQEAAA